jgi:trans-aconitate methyltransferase
MRKLVLFFVLAFFPCLAMEQESKWDAELYDNNSKPQYEASLKNLEKFDLSLPHFKTIVELGCNTANISNTLAQRYPDKTFVGIDPEIDAINLAIQKHSHSKNLVLICDNAQKYSLPRYNIPLANFIGCYHVLHWIPREEQQNVFNNSAANLADNGIIDVSSSAKQENTSLTKAVLKTILKPKWWSYLPSCIPQVLKGQNFMTLLTAPELQQIATTASLLVDRCEEMDKCNSFASREEFLPWLTAILKPYGIDAIFKERQTEFVNDAVDLYCQDYNPTTDGTIEYQFKALHLTAHKPARCNH